MSQVRKVEPETLSGIDPMDKQTNGFPAIGTPEHAALVAAIKLNFPEIYANLDDSAAGEHTGKLRPRSLWLGFEPIR
jgi:hypothetical protein